jgi:hypothetical protein
VSGTETRLRELLEIAVGEPPAGVSVPKVRHLARRRRALQAVVAATAASVCVSIVAVGATGLVSGRPSAPGPSAAGVPPPYYIQQGIFAGNSGIDYQPAVVRDTATGAVTATVNCPWAGAAITSGIAAMNDETFFMACLRTSGSFPHQRVIGSRIYRFHLTGAGTVDGYSLVPGGTLPGRDVAGLAAAANGSAIAMQISPGPPGVLPWEWGGTMMTDGSALLVISTSTGAHAIWQWTSAKDADDYSLSPDGRDLTFVVSHHKAGIANGDGQPPIELAQVSPASRGGNLLSSARMLVRLNALNWSWLNYYGQPSPDRSTLTVAGNPYNPAQGYVGETIAQISVATGKIIHVLFREVIPTGLYSGAAAGSDPSGRYIILIYRGSTVHNGWLDHGRLVPLVPTNAVYETW